MKNVEIIGGGLAGCEAAFFLAEKGFKVTLYDIKPEKFTVAHKNPMLGELLCSNSLRSDSLTNAVGLLKAEMRMMNSLIMEAADKTKVPAGSALAVDRTEFAKYITGKITNHKNINFICKEVTEVEINNGNSYKIIAAGPLVTDKLSNFIKQLTGDENLFFFDAIAPVVDGETIDYAKVFKASRYNKGTADYLNCPFTKNEYLEFYTQLVNAKQTKLKEFENDKKLFEGCLPVEEIAKRGEDSLRFGPLKPVGLKHPETNKEYYAVVQLRMEDKEGLFYNIVGFQTHLTFLEQQRVFRLIPGLENAKFERFGQMHKNTFINAPKVLDKFFRMKNNLNIYFAGQISGVEGYLESAASGLIAAFSIFTAETKGKPLLFPENTAFFGLSRHITTNTENFQPSNIVFSLIPPSDKKIRKKAERREYIAKRSLEELKCFLQEVVE
jgi:methylenetetrahydrofolate--tRNA-(uracil-5-)-methyltransferase